MERGKDPGGFWSCCSARNAPPGNADMAIPLACIRRGTHAPGGPKWKDDKSVSHCEHCRAAFTVFTRRHHCRHCGGVFCQKCSPFERTLVVYGVTEPCKVCSKCDHYIMRCEDLATAVERNDIEMVDRMLHERYSPNGYVGLFPPLLLAAKNGHAAVVKLLIDAHADPNYSIPASTTYAVECVKCGQITPVAQSEASKGMAFTCGSCNTSVTVRDTNALDYMGRTALHQAVMKPSNRAVIELLLSNKAHLNPITQTGHTPLMLAAGTAQSAHAICLIEAGASVDVVNPLDGQTALHLSIAARSLTTARALLTAGASTNLRDRHGISALDMARNLRLTDITRTIMTAQATTEPFVASRSATPRIEPDAPTDDV